VSEPVEYLLVTGPDQRGTFTVEWSGTDLGEALQMQAEHPEWAAWTCDPSRDPSCTYGIDYSAWVASQGIDPGP
jgi:hypothetical protein